MNPNIMELPAEPIELPKLPELPEFTEQPPIRTDPLKEIKKVINRLYAIIWILLGALAFGILIILLLR